MTVRDAGLPVCSELNCNCGVHKIGLDTYYATFVNAIKSTGKNVFGLKVEHSKNIPGWSEYVRFLYDESRRAFFNWRAAGSPRLGPVVHKIRTCRANFKRQLRWCRRNEQNIKADKIAQKFRSNNLGGFWRDLRNLNPNPGRIAQKIDNISGEGAIADLWKTKFNNILNRVNDQQDRDIFLRKIAVNTSNSVDLINPLELCIAIEKLPLNKCPIIDDIPGEIFKFASFEILSQLHILFNGILSHKHVPCLLTDVMIIPIIKNKLKNPCLSSNYRTIAVSSVASKIWKDL